MPATQDLTEDVLMTVHDLTGPVTAWRELSRSNSTVWHVFAEHGEFAVKRVTDASSSVDIELTLVEMLADHPAVRGVTGSRRLGSDWIVVSPYLAGKSLDQILASELYTDEEARRWAVQLESLCSEVASLPSGGAGPVGLDLHGTSQSWLGFLHAYLDEQRQKAPRVGAELLEPLLRCFDQVASQLTDDPAENTLILADVNNRNLLVRDDNRNLVLLNAPVVWCGDPAFSFGEALIHHDGTRLGRALASISFFAPAKLHFYAALNSFVILAYVARFSPTPFQEAVPWGRRRPLLALFWEHIEAAERAASALPAKRRA